MSNKIRILVVEDVEVAQKVAKVILTSLGCIVHCASSASEAFELISENQYDLILMDLGLPNINGIEATKRIRQLEGSNQNIPIVALTANFDESYKPTCLEAGMNDFYSKPLTKEKAETIISKFKKGAAF